MWRIIFVSSKSQDLESDINILLAQPLEILELANEKISAGNDPEFFIRDNSQSASDEIVQKIIFKPQRSISCWQA